MGRRDWEIRKTTASQLRLSPVWEFASGLQFPLMLIPVRLSIQGERTWTAGETMNRISRVTKFRCGMSIRTSRCPATSIQIAPVSTSNWRQTYRIQRSSFRWLAPTRIGRWRLEAIGPCVRSAWSDSSRRGLKSNCSGLIKPLYVYGIGLWSNGYHCRQM